MTSLSTPHLLSNSHSLSYDVHMLMNQQGLWLSCETYEGNRCTSPFINCSLSVRHHAWLLDNKLLSEFINFNIVCIIPRWKCKLPAAHAKTQFNNANEEPERCLRDVPTLLRGAPTLLPAHPVLTRSLGCLDPQVIETPVMLTISQGLSSYAFPPFDQSLA